MTEDSKRNWVRLAPEIWEMIFRQLDMRTLLTAAQRVCRTWENLIKGTPSIQKALFFTPIERPANSDYTNLDYRITHSPLLTEAFPTVFLGSQNTAREFRFESLDMMQNSHKMEVYIRKEASWRRMLVQQPPIMDFGLLQIMHAGIGIGASRYEIPVGPQSPHRICFRRKQVNNQAEKASSEPLDPEEKGLRMGRLFEVLLFSHKIRYIDWYTTHIRWATESPLEIIPHETIGRCQVPLEFRAMMREYGLVIQIRHIVKCYHCNYCMDWRNTNQEAPRKQLVVACKEAGLEIDDCSIGEFSNWETIFDPRRRSEHFHGGA